MIRQYELIQKVKGYNPKADVAMLNQAFVYSMQAHAHQTRASGQPYLAHPLEVASILADLKLDDAAIAVGLLHDTLEDTLSTREELAKLFGAEVAELTDGVTKLSRIAFNDKATEQAENFRKLLLAMSKDIRVLLVKLADRLHNMRTIDYIPKPDKRKRIAQETMDIFAPLADRIGLHQIKSELEDIAFKTLEPLEYERIDTRMIEWRAQDNLVERVLQDLQAELKKAGIEARVTGREKTIYSIWRKMHRKNLAFDQLTDIVAYRVIVKRKRDCYNVLGLLHDVYRAIPGRFKDYISAPKPNGYQSLHTAVIGPFGNRMEVQIRTEEMHTVAESGVTAHWLYKADGKAATEDMAAYDWLAQLVDHLQGLEDPSEFYENAKLELFSDNVFVFTPKGDLVALPQGATPLDFAYNVHSDVGHRCQAARINGRVVPLRTPLVNGDMVEILTSKAQRPNPGWREFVVTAKAKTAINRYLRLQERDEQLRLGKDMLEKFARRENFPLVQEKELAAIAPHFKLEGAEDMYIALSQGRIVPRQIFAELQPPEKLADEEKENRHLDKLHTEKLNGAEKSAKIRAGDTSVGIEGLTPGMAIHLAKCCSPLPGEEITGIITTGKGVTIHRKDCGNLTALSDQPDRWLSVKWTQEELRTDALFTARLRLHLLHRPGTLSSVTTAIFNAGGNISDFSVESRGGEIYTLRCDVEVQNRDHFNRLVANLESLKTVHAVERAHG